MAFQFFDFRGICVRGESFPAFFEFGLPGLKLLLAGGKGSFFRVECFMRGVESFMNLLKFLLLEGSLLARGIDAVSFVCLLYTSPSPRD